MRHRSPSAFSRNLSANGDFGNNPGVPSAPTGHQGQWKETPHIDHNGLLGEQ
jgi:hypothetical protein